MSPFVPPGVRIAAAIGVVGTFLVTGSFVLGRVTASDHSDSTPAAAPTGGGSAPPVAAAGRGIAGAPTRVNSLGIPVGYPHTQAGAISACGNYISSIQNLDSRNRSRLDAIFASIGTSKSATALTQKILSSDSQTAKNFGVPSINSPNFTFDLRVVGYKIQKSSRDDVTISVWSTAGVGVLNGSEDLAPQQIWGTDICTVTWSDQDWRLSNAGDGPNGPSITERAADDINRFAYAGGRSS